MQKGVIPLTCSYNERGAVEEIKTHRKEIDAIDKQLVALLNQRAYHSLVIRDAKPEVGMALYDPKREVEILKKVYDANNQEKGPLYNDHIREIYESILRVMKEIPSL